MVYLNMADLQYDEMTKKMKILLLLETSELGDEVEKNRTKQF